MVKLWSPKPINGVRVLVPLLWVCSQVVWQTAFNRYIVGSIPTRPTLPSCPWKKINMKEGNYIKQIDKRALNILIQAGYVDASRLNGITLTSKGKKSRGKNYFAKDKLAFTAWHLLNERHDKDYLVWLRYLDKTEKAKEKS